MIKLWEQQFFKAHGIRHTAQINRSFNSFNTTCIRKLPQIILGTIYNRCCASICCNKQVMSVKTRREIGVVKVLMSVDDGQLVIMLFY